MNHRGRSISENKIIDIRGYRGPLDKEILAFKKSISVDYAARGRAFASASRSQRLTKSSTIKTNESSNKGDAMQAISESLLNAKLEAAEARTEARIARLEGLVESSIKNNETAIAEFKEENKHTRRSIIITGITSVIAIVLGVAAFNATLLSNMMGSFEMGQSTKESIKSEVSAQTKTLNEKLDKLIELQQAQPSKP